MHPEVEAKVLAELQALQLMPSTEQLQPRAMEYDDVARLTYTSNAIKASRCLPYCTAMGIHLSPQMRHQTGSHQFIIAPHSTIERVTALVPWHKGHI